MSRTNRQNFRTLRTDRKLLDALLRREVLEELVDLDVAPANDVAPPVRAREPLEDVLRAQRWQLVAVARHYAGEAGGDPAEVVRLVCEEALAGALGVSEDPEVAMSELRAEIAARCAEGVPAAGRRRATWAADRARGLPEIVRARR